MHFDTSVRPTIPPKNPNSPRLGGAFFCTRHFGMEFNRGSGNNWSCAQFGGISLTEEIMPKYFFHVRRNDVFEEDPEGIDLASPELACEEATAAAREIVAERIRTGDPANGGAFEIMTEDGALVATVPFRSAIHLD
ncbi:DUF6894 family protein [Rhizobium leguminosarum]